MSLLNIFIPQAMAADGPGVGQGDPSMLIMLLVVVIAMYFMVWRPQQSQRKSQNQLLAGLKAGDEVITSGGIAGVIAKIDGSFVLLTVAQGVCEGAKSGCCASLTKGYDSAQNR